MTLSENQFTHAWTPAEDATLQQQWAEGKSAGLIGHILGRSRNSVIGRVHRKGWQRRGPPLYYTPRKRGPQRSEPKPKAVKPKPSLPGRVTFGIAALAPVITEPPSLNKRLWELGEHDCHWPINDGGPFLFCAHEKAGNGPYCAFHAEKGVTSKTPWGQKI